MYFRSVSESVVEFQSVVAWVVLAGGRHTTRHSAWPHYIHCSSHGSVGKVIAVHQCVSISPVTF